jgi:hypothetical protein
LGSKDTSEDDLRQTQVIRLSVSRSKKIREELPLPPRVGDATRKPFDRDKSTN